MHQGLWHQIHAAAPRRHDDTLRTSSHSARKSCSSRSDTGITESRATRSCKHVLAGDVVVLRPGIPTETTVEGDAELVQVFIEPESRGHMASNTVTGTRVEPTSGALNVPPFNCSWPRGTMTGEAAAWPKSDYDRLSATCWRHRSTARGNRHAGDCHQWQSAVQST